MFELMWEAYAAGAIPVGAVVVDEAGAVVARGRNRIHDDAVPGHLARTRLAHAEINALAQLRPPRTFEDHTLYSALEPCHLCAAASFSARVGSVRYREARPDVVAAADRLPAPDAALADAWDVAAQ